MRNTALGEPCSAVTLPVTCVPVSKQTAPAGFVKIVTNHRSAARRHELAHPPRTAARQAPPSSEPANLSRNTAKPRVAVTKFHDERDILEVAVLRVGEPSLRLPLRLAEHT